MYTYQAPNNLLKDKVILVTGASDGIGKVVAEAYAQYGATVILHGRNIEKLEQVYDKIVANNYPQPAILPLDLQNAAQHQYTNLAETIQSELGKLDGILHNAAMISELTPIEYTDANLWHEMMQVNINSVFMLTQACLPLLREVPDASIITTTSGVGKKGRAYWGAYAVSKFAIEGFTQVLADEMENTNIRVNSINPGATQTKMRATAFPAEDASRLTKPSELINLYLYLMGTDSLSIHGKSIDAQAG